MKHLYSIILSGILCLYNLFLVSGVKTNISDCSILRSGELLHDIQISRIFNDSKDFVDLELRFEPSVVYLNFKNINKTSNGVHRSSLLKEFVNQNFKHSDVLQKWVPADWKTRPLFIEDVYDKSLRHLLYKINRRWKVLGRKINTTLISNDTCSSLISVPHPFIIPGGRFREFYYWDSYWIIEGLLLSNMYDTAKGMIKNFLYLVDKFGYVPNGPRTYYLNRSQPPFLIPMMDIYYEETKDIAFLNQSMVMLNKEFNFWTENRQTIIKSKNVKYTVYYYKVNASSPRPESYYEDYIIARNMSTEDQSKLYSEIYSAAESGWDFSSRWMFNGTKTSNLRQHLKTSTIIPVCLNSLMAYNAKIMAKFYAILEDSKNSTKYSIIAAELNRTISRVFWSDREGSWFDFDTKTSKLRSEFYLSNLSPLWFETFGSERQKSYIVNQVIDYIERYDLDKYLGGLPTSMYESGEQWDLPNNWPPLQYFVVMGLYKAGAYSHRAKELSRNLAEHWIINVYNIFKDNSELVLEKYNAKHAGEKGQGGEYAVQNGFGWTNGILLKFLSTYNHSIRTSHVTDYVCWGLVIVLVGTTIIAVSSYTKKVGCISKYKFARFH